MRNRAADFASGQRFFCAEGGHVLVELGDVAADLLIGGVGFDQAASQFLALPLGARASRA